MTVSAQTPINRSTGNGVTTVFPYTFKIISEGDIEVTVDDMVKTLNVDYTVTGEGLDAGGNVTMTTAPASGTTVVRRRNMAIVRTTDYQDQGSLPAATLDLDIDSTVLMVQQLDERLDRTFSLPVSSAADSTMPAPTGGYVLGWDALGENLVNLPATAGTSLIDLAASSGSSLVGFMQGGTDPVARTVQDRIRETVSVKDFGAVGDGVTDDTAAIQKAINYVFTKPSIGLLNQIGGVVWFPAGRYRVTSTLTGLTDGITIRGEPSGLDSVPLAQAGSGSQIFCDNTVGDFPMFTVNDGGPITIQDIGLNGTQTITNSVCIKTGTGLTNIGITQAHFSNVRFTGFTSVFSGTKLADVSFYDCGFEYNTTCFDLQGGTYTSLGGVKFVSCIFFGGASSVFTLGSAAVLNDMAFSACLFEYDTAQTVNCDIFQVYDATLSNISFSACNFIGYNSGDSCIRTLSTSSSVKEITFSSCNFKTLNALNIAYSAPTGAMYDIIFNGCIFQNSNITAAYELTDLIIANSVVRGTSTVSLTSCNNLSIIGNDFVNASVNPPIVFTDVFNRVLVTNNIFADAVTSLSINGSSTKVNISNNINGSTTVSIAWTTVTAGSGGWTNHATTPQFYKDALGYISLRGLVTNAAPGAFSIMCSLPVGFRPDVTQYFIVPETAGTGYVTAAASTDGSIYCVSRSGTGSNYDLSTIRVHGA